MLKLAGLANDSIVDGPGIRLGVFCQGCPHHCPGCQNPETWAFSGGTELSAEKILSIVKQNPLCRGVTFSGGEPFSQAQELTVLAKLLRAEHYEIASYSGYTFEELMSGEVLFAKELLGELDVLVDGRFLLAERTLELRFRGSRNQRVLDVPKSLAAGAAVLCTEERWVGMHE
ncbi:MAG: anaerobic ribonucleoside-triphosphate reductase activating protein [Pygmaiobacter sp.]